MPQRAHEGRPGVFCPALRDAESDLLAHITFPETHRRQIRSTNPLERLNKEIKRRTAVVGSFPTGLRSSAWSG
jgi:transposase-like protein